MPRCAPAAPPSGRQARPPGPDCWSALKSWQPPEDFQLEPLAFSIGSRRLAFRGTRPAHARGNLLRNMTEFRQDGRGEGRSQLLLAVLGGINDFFGYAV